MELYLSRVLSEKRAAGAEGFLDQSDAPAFEIPKTTVDQARRAAGDPRAKVVFLEQGDRKTVDRGQTRQGSAVDAAANDDKVVVHAWCAL